MKTLILVRHAKSSWNHDVPDFDRPLNERGKKDAPEMAKRLKNRLGSVDIFVSSPAKRARKTARVFAEAFEVKKDDILLVDMLYLASPEAFARTIATLGNQASSAALFAHNPGITTFASSLTEVRIDEMPTCAIFAVQADTDDWAGFMEAPKTFLFFDYPKAGE